MRTIIVSGLSGSGKSVALHTLEDEGFYCVDNLPGMMLPDLIDMISQQADRQIDNMAVGIDARSLLTSMDAFLEIVLSLRSVSPRTVEILFLETSRNVLIQRFSETRRKHPLSFNNVPLVSAIEQESLLMQEIQSNADWVIETSALNLHQLRQTIHNQLLDTDFNGPALLFQSFGFKHGIPASTDFVFDVRCLPNPYWDSSLRSQSGLDEPVSRFLEQHRAVGQTLTDIGDYVERWLPSFREGNRAYLTISIGCTGGRHRSVYIAQKLRERFAGSEPSVGVRHRDIGE